MTDPVLSQWLLNEIKEELNVKEVILARDDRAHVELMAKPNYKRLGKRLGSRIKDLTQALQGLSQADLWVYSDTGILSVAGETFHENDILLEKHPKAGCVVASEGGVSVLLDTTRTPELEREGWVREFAARIQAQRKVMGLGVSRYIQINLCCDHQLFQAIFSESNHMRLLQDLRCQEIRAVLSQNPSESFDGDFLVDEIDGMTFHYQVIPC